MRFLTSLWFVSILCLSLVCGYGRGLAQQRSLVIDDFHVEIRVHPDGSMDVIETLRPHFIGSWNGVFRTIPVKYRTPEGFSHTLRLDLQEITDGSGRSLKYESSQEGYHRKYKIWVPGARNARRTVRIHYRVANGLRFFDNHDELYWNITGTEWEVPIARARADIQLPEGVTGVRAVAFTGVYGSREREAEIDIRGNHVRVQATRRLNFREGLTAAVGWDPGVVRRPGLLEKAGFFVQSNWLFVIPVLTFAGMFFLWHRMGRDPRLRPISPQYEPPEKLSPAEVGTLVDNYPDVRDITATLVDLAVRGYVVIEEVEKDRLFGLLSSTDYALVLQKPIGECMDLPAHERKLLQAVFSGYAGERVELEDLENEFYKHLPDLRKRIYQQLLERRYYVRRPDKVKGLFITAALFLGFLVIGIGAYAGVFELAPVSVIGAAVLTTGVTLGFGWFMPARTLHGARVLEGILGFEDFLSRVEADRYKRMIDSPEMFEKYLPYAMALGVEGKWAKAFEDMYKEPPQWYRGGDLRQFHTRSFVSRLNGMSTRAATAMTTAPRSSGGSGFSGGSSGGGGGGGGGGGF